MRSLLANWTRVGLQSAPHFAGVSLPAMPIPQGLSELNRAWQMAAAGAALSASNENAETTPAPMVARQARVRDLSAADLPCLLLLKSGLGRVVVTRKEAKVAVLGGDGNLHDLDISALEAEEAGTVFGPRRSGLRKPEPQSEEQEKALGPQLIEEMLLKRRPIVIQLLVVAALGNVLMLSLPLFSMAVYDRVVPHAALETLWALATGVILALVLDLALRYVRLKLQDAIALAGSDWLQTRAFQKLLTVRLADKPQSAASFSAQIREVEAFCQCVPPVITGLAIDLPFLMLSLALLIQLGGAVALVPVLGVALLIGSNSLCHAMSMTDAMRTVINSRAQADILMDTLSELEAIKASGRDAILTERWARLQERSTLSGHNTRLISGLSAYSNSFLGQFVVVLTIIASVYAIADGVMTVGAMSASTMLVGRLLAPMGQLAAAWHRMSSIKTALSGLEAFLKLPSETYSTGAEQLSRPKAGGAIAFRAVKFAYSGGSSCMNGVSFDIKSGERIGLIGQSGSGKSTLMRLLTRLHDPNEGTVLFDGRNIAQYDPRDLRTVLGYMPQEPALFDDTLLANIAVTSGEVDRERLARAVETSGVKDFASRHPEGFGLRVGRRGERLSVGERQSVLLARLLYLDPPVLLLDEPTASMDTILEARIARNLASHLEGKTLIMATHRSSLLPLVDRLIWIEQGRVAADGPKQEVLAHLAKKAA